MLSSLWGDMSGARGSVLTLRLGQSFLMEQSKAVKTEDEIEKLIEVGMSPLKMHAMHIPLALTFSHQ